MFAEGLFFRPTLDDSICSSFQNRIPIPIVFPADCMGNQTVHKQCGMGNGCMGSMEDWVCVCEAFGWIAHETDLMQCHQRKRLVYVNVILYLLLLCSTLNIIKIKLTDTTSA